MHLHSLIAVTIALPLRSTSASPLPDFSKEISQTIMGNICQMVEDISRFRCKGEDDAGPIQNPTRIYGNHEGSKSRYEDGIGTLVSTDDRFQFENKDECWTDLYWVEEVKNTTDWKLEAKNDCGGNSSECFAGIDNGVETCNEWSLGVETGAELGLKAKIFDAKLTAKLTATKGGRMSCYLDEDNWDDRLWIYQAQTRRLQTHDVHHAQPTSLASYHSPKMPKKMFKVLENNPEVMNHLGKELGMDENLAFYDIYSLTDPDLLAFIPRPAYALLVIIPMTPTWNEARTIEDKDKGDYEGKGEEEPVIWFKQTIGNACGSIGLVHSLLNSDASKHIVPGSTLAKIRDEALPKAMEERARVLEDSDAFEEAHADAVILGDTPAPTTSSEDNSGQHFVSFVKAKDGHLWELEGGRKGPLDRGLLKDDEDVLSPAAVEMGLGKLMRIEAEKGGDLRFSAIALAPAML
ncbi:hypothetical protein E8E13_008469 [Curvularia kusanoi]|uniref:Ubiquitin carboxyl-terminal hydrolase n=1 Tax=Curvularia kusanoi TaxID=90978 RepID=A0A9P4W8Z4_CURKU|nr:hypothetical protein E8E13_008469 [Curvularia kusanoi]